jgi:hypothetical protein
VIRLLILLALVSARPSVAAEKTAPRRPHFDFLYSQGWGTRLSTYDSTLTKDEVVDPDTTIHFVLPKADLDSVFAKMMEIDFFDMQEPHPVWPDTCPGGVVPNTQIRLEATLGDKNKQLTWSTDRIICIMNARGPWHDLWDLEHLILRIIYRQPEFQALPEPQGAYR